ncbi:MAG TPA: alkaline phosphatase family protein [Anaerolineales bacterium]|nr:alkaline phosphatase family protein [Anaerolineales bacterium]
MLKFYHHLLVATLLCLSLSACSPAASIAPLASATASPPPTSTPPPPPSPVATASSTPAALVPDFAHIVIVVFENKEFGTVVDNYHMPYFNKLAQSYTLLTQYYAVTHPSLPNYLAMIGGDTFGITYDCTICTVPNYAQSLPDQIETSGRTWRTYQEDMPSACFTGAEAGNYAMKHNPFIYFMPIRLNSQRCTQSIVPFAQLSSDIASGALPNFIFVTPNMCNDAHDCAIDIADAWLQKFMGQIMRPLDQGRQPYLIVITWDEGQGNHSCCGLPAEAGGRIATILVSPQAKAGFQDDTPYSHYSLLKTIESAWGLPYLGHSADAQTSVIVAPWK